VSTHRVDYTGEGLAEADLASSPYEQLTRWVEQAAEMVAGVADAPEALAMSLATVDAAGRPDVRPVLVRFLDDRGPGFVTDGGSAKARQVAANPAVAATIAWPRLFRVVRLRGYAEPVEAAVLAGYWAQRPWGSRISAWASHQSEPVASRGELAASFDRYAARWPDHGGADDVPIPPTWAGLRLRPVEVEFWAGRSNRLHDRLAFVALDPVARPSLADASAWTVVRRQP
jgi:pyridoxamine 5'-phosphate oxidase